MTRITCGGCSAAIDIANDGIARAAVHGLVAPGNAGALGAELLQAAAERGGGGALIAVDRALLAMPPVGPLFYRYIPPLLRDVPVAVLVSPEQTPVYAALPQAAAELGAMRRAFLSRAEAEAWLLEQMRSLNANRAWWSLRR